MSDTRTPEEIERDIERERSDLQHTIGDIKDSFSPDAIVRAVTDQFRTHGGDVSRSVATAARDNPIALALTGVGLAWMIFGQGTPPSETRRSAYDDDRYPSGSRHITRGSDPSPMRPRSAVPAGETPHWLDVDDLHDEEDYDYDYEESSGPGIGDRAGAAWDSTRGAASSAGSGVSSAAASGRERLGSAASSARSGMAGAATRTRDGFDRAASGMRQRGARARAALSEGTETMSDAARARVISAREQALAARASAERNLRRGADRAADFYEDHPLVAGALALAVGAAVAGAMPRTRTEDSYLGERSDDLYHEAERIFHEERAKMERVANEVADEASSIADEARQDADKVARDAKDRADSQADGSKTAADAVADRVEDAAQRISDRTRDAAKNEDLGRTKT